MWSLFTVVSVAVLLPATCLAEPTTPNITRDGSNPGITGSMAIGLNMANSIQCSAKSRVEFMGSNVLSALFWQYSNGTRLPAIDRGQSSGHDVYMERYAGGGSINYRTWFRVLHFKTTQSSVAGNYTCVAKYNEKYWNQSVNILVSNIYCDGDPGIPENGQRSTFSTVYTSEVRYSCFSGYTLQGSDRRTCQSNGKWNESLPQCNRNGMPPMSSGTSPTSSGTSPTSSGTSFAGRGAFPTSSGTSPTSRDISSASSGISHTSSGTSPTSRDISPTSSGTSPTSRDIPPTSSGTSPTSRDISPTSSGTSLTSRGTSPTMSPPTRGASHTNRGLHPTSSGGSSTSTGTNETVTKSVGSTEALIPGVVVAFVVVILLTLVGGVVVVVVVRRKRKMENGQSHSKAHLKDSLHEEKGSKDNITMYQNVQAPVSGHIDPYYSTPADNFANPSSATASFGAHMYDPADYSEVDQRALDVYEGGLYESASAEANWGGGGYNGKPVKVASGVQKISDVLNKAGYEPINPEELYTQLDKSAKVKKDIQGSKREENAAAVEDLYTMPDMAKKRNQRNQQQLEQKNQEGRIPPQAPLSYKKHTEAKHDSEGKEEDAPKQLPHVSDEEPHCDIGDGGVLSSRERRFEYAALDWQEK